METAFANFKTARPVELTAGTFWKDPALVFLDTGGKSPPTVLKRPRTQCQKAVRLNIKMKETKLVIYFHF